MTQGRVLEAIAQFIEKNGYSPSYEEIGQAVGLRSRSSVRWHVENLKRAGMITQSGRRDIRVVSK